MKDDEEIHWKLHQLKKNSKKEKDEKTTSSPLSETELNDDTLDRKTTGTFFPLRSIMIISGSGSGATTITTDGSIILISRFRSRLVYSMMMMTVAVGPGAYGGGVVLCRSVM